MTTYTKQEFYSTGNRGIVSRIVNGKKLNEDISIAVDDHWNNEDNIKACAIDSSSVSYQDAEGLVNAQHCGIPIAADSLCISADNNGNYSFGNVDYTEDEVIINGQHKSITEWRQSGTLFVQDTCRVWSSEESSQFSGVDEFEMLYTAIFDESSQIKKLVQPPLIVDVCYDVLFNVNINPIILDVN